MSEEKKLVAIVTGAGGGIGAGIARKLSADGYTVACVDLKLEAAQAVAAEIPGAIAFKVDVSKEIEVIGLREELRASVGAPTLLVNAAGVLFEHSVLTLTEDSFDLIMDVNLKGIFFMCKTFIPDFLAAGKGNIVNISSTAGLHSGTNRAVYCASKAGVIMFTRSLVADYGSKGVRANIVCPGLIDTPMANWIKEDAPALAAWEKRIPAQRIGTVEDVANAVSFLASDASSYIHGESLLVDGGGLA
jgi:NAD(P)-dependent dehydrogenase (short-subunit alcohol dehydrogenase family)